MRLGTTRKPVRRSTRTTRLEEAKRIADELYEEPRYKQKNKQPLKSKSFKQIAASFLEKTKRDTLEGRLSEAVRFAPP